MLVSGLLRNIGRWRIIDEGNDREMAVGVQKETLGKGLLRW